MANVPHKEISVAGLFLAQAADGLDLN